jgi:predicted SprT family Zn-dependent metalloprotease
MSVCIVQTYSSIGRPEVDDDDEDEDDFKCQSCGCQTSSTKLMISQSRVKINVCERCEKALMLVGWIPVKHE